MFVIESIIAHKHGICKRFLAVVWKGRCLFLYKKDRLARYREVASGNLSRLARLSTGKRRVSVLSPIRALSFFEREEQILEFGGVLGVLVCASGFNPRLIKYEKGHARCPFPYLVEPTGIEPVSKNHSI